MSASRAVLLLAALILLVAPVAAHGNYVSADPQASADGTVRVEFASVITDGFLVLHADDNGSFGPAVGNREFEGNLASDYAIELDEGYWANQSGNLTLWVVLHRDDGDGTFEPGEDPVQTSASGDAPIAARFAVRKAASGPANVIAERDEPQATGRNAVTIEAVRLGTDGYVVIRADESGAPGRVVGSRAITAGEHGAVNVTIDEAFYERRPEEFALWAVVHRSDGDGAFNASTDRAVTVGDSTVMSRFWVERTDPIERTPTPAATPTGTATAAVHADPSPTATPTASGDHGDHEHTDGPSTETTAAASSDGHDHTHGSPSPGAGTSTPGQPGLTAAAAVVGVLLAGLLAARRTER